MECGLRQIKHYVHNTSNVYHDVVHFTSFFLHKDILRIEVLNLPILHKWYHLKLFSPLEHVISKTWPTITCGSSMIDFFKIIFLCGKLLIFMLLTSVIHITQGLDWTHTVYGMNFNTLLVLIECFLLKMLYVTNIRVNDVLCRHSCHMGCRDEE